MFAKSDEEENKNDGNMKLCSFLPPGSWMYYLSINHTNLYEDKGREKKRLWHLI